MTQPAGPHRGIKLDYGGAEVLCRRPEFVHRDAFGV
jgi:hypothetical protein